MPNGGVKTVISAEPTLATSAAEIAAVSCVLETKVVGRGVPFHSTVDVDIKFAPATVMVDAEPIGIVLGETEPITGMRGNDCEGENPHPSHAETKANMQIRTVREGSARRRRCFPAVVHVVHDYWERI